MDIIKVPFGGGFQGVFGMSNEGVVCRNYEGLAGGNYQDCWWKSSRRFDGDCEGVLPQIIKVWSRRNCKSAVDGNYQGVANGN
jgi:hypothetical protein